MEKTSWKTLVDWQSLSASSIVEKEEVMTIKSISREQIVSSTGRKEIVPVCRFENSALPMVLNKTNMRTLSRIFASDNIEDWYGKQIIVFVQDGIKFGGELVQGLRIKALPVRLCSVCGKVIPEHIYNGSLKKYGRALCGADCLAKAFPGAEEPKNDETEVTENVSES